MRTTERVEQRRAAHHRALEALASTVGCQTDGLTLWRKLRRLEADAHLLAERYCNGAIDTREWDRGKAHIHDALRRIFGGSGSIPAGVFINSDARGHALKLDSEQVAIPDGMQTDWGQDGILAAEIEES